MTRRISLAAATVALATCAAFGCGTSPSPNGTYTIAFQSTDEAVATDSVRVLVFDPGTLASQEACAALLGLRATNQDLPPAIVEVPPAGPCDFRNGGGSFSARFGDVAVLVLAQRKGVDLARGCSTHHLGADATNVLVEVALVPKMSVAPTTCASLSQHCGGGC